MKMQLADKIAGHKQIFNKITRKLNQIKSY